MRLQKFLLLSVTVIDMIFSPLPSPAIVTQVFGARPEYYKKYGLKGHNGIDLRCGIGTALFAPCEGYVKFGDEGTVGYGKFVKITSLPYSLDGERREITLGHLSRFVDRLAGHYVAAGDLIGFTGNTGDSSGPHVHMTYKKLDCNGNILNNDNGYHGAIDVAPYTDRWVKGDTLDH